MLITESKLRKIIAEEYQKIVSEIGKDSGVGDEYTGVKRPSSGFEKAPQAPLSKDKASEVITGIVNRMSSGEDAGSLESEFVKGLRGAGFKTVGQFNKAKQQLVNMLKKQGAEKALSVLVNNFGYPAPQ